MSSRLYRGITDRGKRKCRVFWLLGCSSIGGASIVTKLEICTLSFWLKCVQRSLIGPIIPISRMLCSLSLGFMFTVFLWDDYGSGKYWKRTETSKPGLTRYSLALLLYKKTSEHVLTSNKKLRKRKKQTASIGNPYESGIYQKMKIVLGPIGIHIFFRMDNTLKRCRSRQFARRKQAHQ